MNRIETIARGVFVRGGKLLVCVGKKQNNIYLPGGHIEFGETGAIALAREIKEELGLDAKVGKFLGCAEHFFLQRGKKHAEINLVYAMTISGIDGKNPAAKEDWIKFEWLPLEKLRASALEPATLRTVLPRWLETKSNNIVSTKNNDGIN